MSDMFSRSSNGSKVPQKFFAFRQFPKNFAKPQVKRYKNLKNLVGNVGAFRTFVLFPYTCLQIKGKAQGKERIMSFTKNEMMNLINLVSPEVIDPAEHRGENMLDIYHDIAANNFLELAKSIPAEAYCLDHVRKFMTVRNIYETAAQQGYSAEEAEQVVLEQLFSTPKKVESYKAREISDFAEDLEI